MSLSLIIQNKIKHLNAFPIIFQICIKFLLFIIGFAPQKFGKRISIMETSFLLSATRKKLSECKQIKKKYLLYL